MFLGTAHAPGGDRGFAQPQIRLLLLPHLHLLRLMIKDPSLPLLLRNCLSHFYVPLSGLFWDLVWLSVVSAVESTGLTSTFERFFCS